jgi:ABC-type lipoprotein release transport system permease subunit
MGLMAAALGTVLGSIAVLYHMKFGIDIAFLLGPPSASSLGYSFSTLVFPVFEWTTYFKLLAVELLFVVGAGVYPAFKASSLDPVETMRG